VSHTQKGGESCHSTLLRGLGALAARKRSYQARGVVVVALGKMIATTFLLVVRHPCIPGGRHIFGAACGFPFLLLELRRRTRCFLLGQRDEVVKVSTGYKLVVEKGSGGKDL